jgi:4-hydroxybenzoate polyprenyltransferase
MNLIFSHLLALRPHHWVKNFFVFIPVFFAGEIFEFYHLRDLFLGFLSFSIVSSSVYLFNDIRDIEKDKMHARKKMRPIASGKVKVQTAIAMSVLCLITGILVSLKIDHMFTLVLGIYFLINILYSFGLKSISILDIIIISIGFVLRISAGGIIAGVPISSWLIIMVFLLAMFLAIAKRRDDLLVFLNSGKIMRKSIENYNLEFINSVLTLISGIIMVSYIMYTISVEVSQRMHSDYLYLTSIFVISGLMRYLQIVFVENDSGSPVRILFRDRFIQITLLGWIISFYVIIYVGN